MTKLPKSIEFKCNGTNLQVGIKHTNYVGFIETRDHGSSTPFFRASIGEWEEDFSDLESAISAIITNLGILS